MLEEGVPVKVDIWYRCNSWWKEYKRKRSEVLVLINPFNLPSTTMEFHEPLDTEIGFTCGCQDCTILLNHLPSLGGTDLELFKETRQSLLKH